MFTLKQRLAAILEYDAYTGKNGKYEIHSIYFDDYKDVCARENVSGEGKRFKYRIRYYNDDSRKLFLEKKEKQNSYCYKRKYAISMEEYDRILNGEAMNVFWGTDDSLLKEFCIDIVTRRFAPKVIINYEREAFVENISDIRITLDYNISASDEFDRFLSGDYLKIPVLEKQKHVLEVKFNDIFPSYIKRVLQANIFQQQSFSKYYLGRIAIQEKKKYCKNI